MPSGPKRSRALRTARFRAPDEWFAEAAEVGLGIDLEVAALDSALEQLPQLPSDLYLSLNASVETIMSDDFESRLDDVPAERIVLELTEHTGSPTTPTSPKASNRCARKASGWRSTTPEPGSRVCSTS